MLGHALILSSMFAAATGLLLYSLSLPPEGLDNNAAIIVTATPEPVVTASVSPSDDAGTPNATPSAVASATPAPTPTPTPKPTEEPLTSYNIAATTPQSVLRQAQVHAGRVDPFKSVQPPDLPDFEPAISANQLALPAAFPALKPEKSVPVRSTRPIIRKPDVIETPATTPPQARPLTQGLSLKGIMDGGIDPIAIIEINGRTELFRVGERLPNNIRVTSINYEARRVTLSRGQATGTLYLPEPNSPNF